MEREYWSGSDITFWCLVDRKRTLHLKRVIKKIVKPNDVIVDAGTGTGILAMLAVQAGAKRVYAIEVDKNLWNTLEDNFKNNGYSHKIELLKQDARKVKIPEKVDVIMAEMIATGLIDEIQIPALNNILPYLKKGGTVIPCGFKNFIELVYNNNRFYGNKLQIIRYEYSWHPELSSLSYSNKLLYKAIDFTEINSDKIDAELILKISKKGSINGIKISNETIFPDNSMLRDSEAYCMPLILPITECKVKNGDKFLIRLSYNMCKGLKTLNYSIVKL